MTVFLQKQLTTLFPQKSSIIDILHGFKWRSSHTKVFYKKSGLTNFGNSQENICNRLLLKL